MATATAKIAITGEDRTRKAFNSVQSSLGNLNKSFGSLKAGISAVLGVGGVATFITQMAGSADKIGKVSAKLGISTDALQKFRFGAEQSGVSVSTFDMAIQRMTRRVAEAREGTGEAKKALKEMGISLTDSSGKAKSTEQIFLEVADVMEGMKSQSDKVRLSFKLFDSEGVSLVNMLQQGRGAIKGYGDQLERYGGIIDHKAIKASEDFNDALNLLSKTSATVFTPLIKGLTLVMKGWQNWIDFFTGKQEDPFKLANQSAEELKTRLADLESAQTKMFESQKNYWERLDDEDLKGRARQAVQASLATLTRNMVLNTAERETIEKKILKISKDTQTTKKSESKWLGISMKMQKEHVADLDRSHGTSEEVLKLIKSQNEEHERQKKIVEAEVDEYIKQEEILAKTSKTWYAIIEGIDGSKHKVNGLTKEQAEALVKANKLARAQELYNVAVKKSKDAHEDVLDEIDKQKKKTEEQTEMQLNLLGWVGSFSSTFSAVLKSIKFEIDETTGKLMMTGFSWQTFGLNLLMNSKKMQKSMEMLFGFVDEAVEDLIPGLEDTSAEAEEMAKRAREIDAEVKAMTTTIEGYSLQIKNSTAVMQALAQIEKTYQDRVKKANELDAEHLKYYAQIEKDLGILAYRVGVLRSATQAFASSATQFLDAVATEGFTDLQKRFFAMVTGFARGVHKSYGDIIEQAQKIIDSTPIDPANLKKAFQELLSVMNRQIAEDYSGPSAKDVLEKYGIKPEDTPIFGMFEEIRKFLEKGGAGSHTPEVIRRIMSGYTGVLTEGIGALDKKIIAYNEAVKAIADAQSMLPEALKGLVIMMKDVIRTEYEAGKSKEQLKIDLDALGDTFRRMNISVSELNTYINSLTKPSGAMGGLVKRYPYGGTIQGPSHAGGGVDAELEGGEYVMRKSAVQKYGSGFMNAVNSGTLGGSGGVVVNVYDHTGKKISDAIDDYNNSIRVEVKERYSRNLSPVLQTAGY